MSSNTHLAHVAKELVEILDRGADQMLPAEIAGVVKTHAKIAVGSAWIPVPGVDVAAGAVTIWTMYVRINNKIGLSFADNVLKTIASGVATNLASYAAMSGVASALKLVPGIGTIGGGLILSASLYAITLCSGYVYLKALLLLARRNNGKIDAGSLGSAVQEVLKDKNTIKEFISAAKNEYKVAGKNEDISEDSIINAIVDCNYECSQDDADHKDDMFEDNEYENSEEPDDNFEAEDNEFSKYWKDFFTHKVDLVSKEKLHLDSLYIRCTSKAMEVSSKVVASEYYYLISIGCYFFIKQHDSSSSEYQDAYQDGLECINNAISLLDDKEYIIFKSLYDIIGTDSSEYDYLIDFMSYIPDVDSLENNLLDKDYLKRRLLEEREAKLYSSIIYLIDYIDNELEEDDFEEIFEAEDSLEKCLYCILPSTSFWGQSAINILITRYLEKGYSHAAKEMAKQGIAIWGETPDFSKMDDTERDLWKKWKTIIEEDSVEESQGTNLQLQSQSLPKPDQKEQEYIEMVKDCISDSVISEKERRGLERLRKALGISETRAAELESSLAQLTAEESEYKETILEYYEEDGEITSKARKMLDKLRVAYNISEQRAKEIESSCGK